jgi:polysaccharide transporter, PST family
VNLNFKEFVGNIMKNKDHGRLSVNILAMSVIQISNYLVPIVTIPYLVRTLGFSGYGLMVLVQTIHVYFESLMTYSFVLTAPKDIAQNADDTAKVSPIFHTIVFTKIILFAICFIALTILTSVVPFFAQLQTLIFIGFSILIANLLQIDWFFQGIQQMKNITYINLTSRFLSVVLLFIFVHSPNDVAQAILIVPASQIIASLCGWFLAYRRFGLQFTPPQYLAIKMQCINGFNIFLSQFLVRLYSADVNITVLGLLTNTTTVGTYALANRIFTFIVNTTMPINAALYPYLARLHGADYSRFQKEFRRIFQMYFIGYAVFAFILFFTADWLILLIAKTSNPNAVLMLKILSAAVIVSPFGPLYTQSLILHEKIRYLLIICLIAIAFNFATLIPTFYYFKEIGLAINSVIIYWVIFLVPIVILKRLKIWA